MANGYMAHEAVSAARPWHRSLAAERHRRFDARGAEGRRPISERRRRGDGGGGERENDRIGWAHLIEQCLNELRRTCRAKQSHADADGAHREPFTEYEFEQPMVRGSERRANRQLAYALRDRV